MRFLSSLFILLCIMFIGSQILYGDRGLLNADKQSITAERADQKIDTSLSFKEADWDPLLTIVFAPKDNQENRPVLPSPPIDQDILNTEYQTLKKLQNERTEKQARLFERARNDVILMLMEDLKLAEEEYQPVIQFFYEGWGHISRHVYAEQFYHARRRPTQIYNDLEAYQPLAGSPSYPSDTTAQAIFMAFLAGDLFPEHDYLFQNWANEITHAFEASAFQFASDSVAGREIATRVFDDYKQSLAYKDAQLAASLALISYEVDINHFKSKLNNTERPKSFP